MEASVGGKGRISGKAQVAGRSKRPPVAKALGLVACLLLVAMSPALGGGGDSPGVTSLPSAPLNLVANAGPGAGQITLTWEPPDDDGGLPLTGYRIERGLACELIATVIDTVGPDDLTYTDNGLPNGATRCYQVRALNSEGASAPSNTDDATTYALPGPPRDLVASAGPDLGQLTLTWDAPESDGGTPITAYSIRRGDTCVTFQAHDNVPGDQRTYTDSGLGNNVTMCYRIRAVNLVGEGLPSNFDDATTYFLPLPPQDLTAAAGPGAGEVSLAWQPPAHPGASALTGYLVERGATCATVVENATMVDASTLAFIDTGQGNGASRCYHVRAINANGTGEPSNTASATTFDGPGAPRNLVATAGPGNGQILLAWEAPETNGGTPITEYALYRGDTCVTFQEHDTVPGDQLTYTDSGLGNNVTKCYQVHARNLVGTGLPSNFDDATTFALPSAPRNLVATAGSGAGEISLAWEPPADPGPTPLTGYIIQRGLTCDAVVTSIETVDPSQTTYTDTGLGNGATRCYHVIAENEDGTSEPSNRDDATTYALPGEPRNLTATPGPGAGQITLTWEAPTSDGGTPITSYSIRRGDNCVAFQEHDSVAGDQLTYADSGLGNNVTKCYRVRAVNLVGEGLPSNFDDATTFALPSAPRNLVATAGPGAGEISLAWEPPLDPGPTPLTGYIIQRGLTCDAVVNTIETVDPSQTTYTDTDLPNGATRCYHVVAENDDGTSEPSNTDDATTYALPSEPLNLTADAGPGLGEITLTWEAPASDGGTPITGYSIRRGDTCAAFQVHDSVPGDHLTYTDSGLGNNVTKCYRIRAENFVGTGLPSNFDDATTIVELPSAPRNLVATAGPGAGEISLAWEPPEDEGSSPLTGIIIQRGLTCDAVVNTLETVDPSQTTYTDTGLGNGATRCYHVIAENEDGTSEPSNRDDATTYTLPSEPRNLTATPGPGAGQITLTWEAPTSDGGTPITSYSIRRGDTCVTFQEHDSVAGDQLTYTDTNLGNNVTKCYRVRAVNLVGEGLPSNFDDATTFALPSAPRYLVATAGPGAGEINLAWEPPLDPGPTPLTGYIIQRGLTCDAVVNTIDIVDPSQTTYVDTGLSNGATRCYHVIAENDDGTSEPSNTDDATTFALPGEPRNLTATPGPGAGQITLNWEAPTSDGGTPITSYSIRRGDTCVAFQGHDNVPGDQLTYIDSGLGNNVTKCYRVRAVNLVGEGLPSNFDDATTFALPSAPRNLVATAGPGEGEINLAWEPPLDPGPTPLTGYIIQRGLTCDAVVNTIETVDPSQTTYTDTDLPNGATRCYHVVAENDDGTSEPSNTDDATTYALPSEPLNLTATAGPGPGEITLTWEAPTSDGGTPITSYSIRRGDNCVAFQEHDSVAGDQLTYADSGLGNNVTKCYRVRAVNLVGEGLPSNFDDATTFALPSAPRNLVATAGPGAGEISLAWDPPLDPGPTPLTGYIIQRGLTCDAVVNTIETVDPSQTTYTDTDLPNGATRCYHVIAENDDGTSEPSNTDDATTYALPSEPLNLTATAGPGPGEITLTWEAPTSDGGTPITSYSIRRGDTCLAFQEHDSVAGNQLTYTDSGLGNNVTKCYRARAVNLVGTGLPSNFDDATTFALPSAPRNLVATAGPGAGEISLAWEPPLDPGPTPLTGYIIQRGLTCDAVVNTIETVDPSQTTYTDTDLPNGATRCYHVIAENDDGTSEPSNTDDATTYSLPGEPTNLTATAGPGAGQITLAWEAPTSNGGTPITAYSIRRGDTCAAFQEHDSVAGDRFTYTDSGLGNNVTKCYRVRAVNLAGTGLPSNFDDATTFALPSAPRNLVATSGPGAGEISLAWEPPEETGGSPITEYQVQRADSCSGSFADHDAVPGDQLEYTDSGLGNAVTRCYRVLARTVSGVGSASDADEATTFNVPGPPQSLAADAGPGAGQIGLAWEAPSGDGGSPVTQYHVQRAASCSGTFETLDTLGGSTLIYTDSGLGNGVTRCYRVLAENVAGSGPSSNTASATTFDEPTAAQNLEAAAGPGTGQIALSWQAPGSDGGTAITEYVVQSAGACGGVFGDLDTVGGSTLAYTDSGLGNGVTRCYRVLSRNLAGTGPASNADDATTFDLPGAPRNLAANAGPGAGEITVAWEPPHSDGGTAVTGYTVQSASDCSGTFSTAANVGVVLSYTDSGLGNGVTRCYRVLASNLVGTGPASNTDEATTFDVPGPPQNLLATTGPGLGEISLSWQAPGSDGGTPLTEYRIDRATGCSDSFAEVEVVPASQLAYTDTGLGHGVSRCYRIGAVNEVGAGPSSNTAAATTPVTVPTAPLSLAAVPGPDRGEISLTWQAPGDNGGAPVSGYELYQATGCGGTFTLRVSLGVVVAYKDTGLADGTTYCYKVSARNSAGEGLASATASATTFDRPGAPRNLQAQAGPGRGQVSLSWQAPESDGGMAVTGYKVHRASSCDGSFAVLPTLGNVLAHTDGGLPDGVLRCYKVIALNSVGEGSPSGTADATTFNVPGPPRSPAAEGGPGKGQIRVSWQVPASDGGAPVALYFIERAASPGGAFTLAGSTASTSFTDSGLPNGATFYYKVRARNVVGNGTFSGVVSATTFDYPSAPRNLEAQPVFGFTLATSEGGPVGFAIALDWDPPASTGGTTLTRYIIQHALSGGAWENLSTVDGTLTAFTYLEADPLHPHYFRVIAENVVGQGPPSAVSCSLTHPWLPPLLVPPGGACAGAGSESTEERVQAVRPEDTS